MSTFIPIPSAQKPIQLYMWTKCGFCTKQQRVISSLDAEMTNWFSRNVQVVTVQDPKMYPRVRGYPFWIVRGREDSGFKDVSQIVALRRIVP
ncbi:unnamed protein product [Ectocarpus sp. 12 AP-2014]